MDQEVRILNVHQRVNEVKKAVGYVRKDEKKIDNMYRAVTHNAVTAETRQHFVNNGVLIVPTEISSASVDSSMVTGKGNPIIRFEAKYRVDFINIDAPDDKVSVEMTAHALDQGDKAPGKAHSYATKYAILKILQLETGEEEEGREATKPKKQTPEQAIIGANVQPNAGAMDNIPKERHEYVNRTASTIIDYWNANQPNESYKAYIEIKDNAEKLGVWSMLESKIRRGIKKLGESQQQQAQNGERIHGSDTKHSMTGPQNGI